MSGTIGSDENRKWVSIRSGFQFRNKEVRNMASTTTFGGSDRGYDMSLWYDSKPLKIGWFAMLAAVGSEVVFQRVFGYSHGLDSMTPEFENVWMGMSPTSIPRRNSSGISIG
jgi:hypothetical protein